MAFVDLQNISKWYGNGDSLSRVIVLSDLALSIEEGEFVALMGPSGSGKSTLLSILGAMSHPSSGRVTVDEIDIYGLSDEARADFRREYLGFVFQQQHLMPYLTALENVMLPLAAVPIKARTKRERALLALERVGLKDKVNRLPNQLSGGEQGRTAIARAIVNDPPLLLADEPTGTLDSATGSEIMDLFLDLNADGQTVFMVTHNPNNATLAHRTEHMRDGVLEPASKVVDLGQDSHLPAGKFENLPTKRQISAIR